MESMSGVNIDGQVTNIVTFLAIGLCVGATVLIAQYMGAGERHKMRDTIDMLFTTLNITVENLLNCKHKTKNLKNGR